MVALAHNSGLGLELGDFDAQSVSFVGEGSQLYNAPARLGALRQQMHQFAVANDRAHRAVFSLPLTAEGKLVRNRYLHRSEDPGNIINDPRLNKQLLFERQHIEG